MVIRPVVIAVICVGLFIILESLMVPKVMALTANGFRIDDQSSEKRRNYILQRARAKSIFGGLDKTGLSYDTDLDTLDLIGRIPEELPYNVDYANTYDDAYYLDKSVETRTRKRANIKLEKKYEDQSLPDMPCSCKHDETLEDLGHEIFPRYLMTRSCSSTPEKSSCPVPYTCQEMLYPIALLKKKSKKSKKEDYGRIVQNLTLLPGNLNIMWYAVFRNVSVGCQCRNKFKSTID